MRKCFSSSPRPKMMTTGIAMLYTNFVSCFMLLTVLLAATNSAPTHHLTIGVDGNTPTLIVTSSELGIMTDTERSHSKSSKPRKGVKSTNDKLKAFKAKSTVNYKKDKSFYFSKNSVASMTTATPPYTETPPADGVSMQTIADNVAIDVASSPGHVNSTSTYVAMAFQTSTFTPEVVSYPSTNSPAEQVIETSTGEDAERNTMERTTENITFSTMVAMKPTFMTHSWRETITTTDSSALLTSTSDDRNVEVVGTTEPAEINPVTTFLPSIASEKNMVVSMQSTTVTPAMTTSASTEDNLASITSSTHPDDSSTETETTSTLLPIMETSHTAITTESYEVTSTSVEPILKLIDLEKHATEPFVDLSQTGVGHDNGHDGLKNIKKKQLVDKHYLDAISHSQPLEVANQDQTKDAEVKHVYLGPILMAERTIHITDTKKNATNVEHSPEVETKLRELNFVELKASHHIDPVAVATSTLEPAAAEPMDNHNPADGEMEPEQGPSTVLSTTVFQVAESVATKDPSKAANTMFTSTGEDEPLMQDAANGKMESKISDIQIEVYDSTIDSIVASTNFKDADIPQGKSTKPPLPVAQQERFTQYVIDRTETSTQESINFSTIQVASGKPEPAAIEIHINVSESLGNEGEDVDVSFPLAEYNNNGRSEDTSYDEPKVSDEIKLKISSNSASTSSGIKDKSDEVLVVEIVDNVDNSTESRGKSRSSDDLFISDVKDTYATPPPPPPPPPFQPNFDRDSDTIFYISNTEVKVGETLPATNKDADERKMKLENQFFPVNYMASTHPNVNNVNGGSDNGSDHHIYEEDIILSSNRNQQDSLKIYRNRNEPSPPLDVTYVGESIIEVEQQSPDTSGTTSPSPDHMATPQPDVIIQPAILPEISIGVPVIGELPPQIELKEIDFLPSETQQRRSGVYGSVSDDGNGNINTNAIGSGSNDMDNRLDESSIQYGGDLIDESADGGFDGVEGSYPFGNPATMAKRKPNHMSDYAHLYVNYGVNNMRKDELTVDVKDSGEVAMILDHSATGNGHEHNATLKDLLNRTTFNISGSLNESERISNVTAFSIMEDSMEEKNTEDIFNLISLAIGLFIVILPVVVICSMLWALRYLYKKYHSNSTDNNGNLDTTDGGKGQSNEDAAEKGESVQQGPGSAPSSHIGKDKDEDIEKCPESFANESVVKFASEQPPPMLDSSLDSHCKARELPLILALHSTTSSCEQPSVHDDEILQGPNGSITKMTLENNLLIVETEERNDMSRVARETKMDYNKDGVFVVEVARGIDSKAIPESPVTEGADKMLSMFEPKHNGTMGYKMSNEKISHNNEKVQIHSPPPEDGPRSLQQIEEVEEPVHSPRLYEDEHQEGLAHSYKSNVGLSQSDLSTTSSNDSNKGYCYGNQELYVVEQSGYSTSSPTGNVSLKCDAKDIKDDDSNSQNGRNLELTPEKKEGTKEADEAVDPVNKENGAKAAGEENITPNGKSNEKEVLHSNCNLNESENQQEEDKCKQNDITETKQEENLMLSIDNKNENATIIECNPASQDANDSLKPQIESITDDSAEADEGQATPLNSTKEEMKNDKKEECEQQPPLKDLHLIESDGKSQMEEAIVCDVGSVAENSVKGAKESVHLNGVEDGVAIPNQIESTTEAKNVNETIVCNGHDESSPNKITSEDTLSHLATTADYTKVSTENQNGHYNGPHDSELVSDYLESLVDKCPDVGNHCNGVIFPAGEKSPLRTNGSDALPDLVPTVGDTVHANGGDQLNGEKANTPEFENGYDSIISLPEPPPTTDEMLCSDLSELQLDSLPPPPPPLANEPNGETFNLKDLPPPMTSNGSEIVPNEDATNFYASLPPPPPTTLHVTTDPTINGNMHASPLTPPASPPPHFTNGLHAGICPPIAVDVNGS
ncbi:serine-rich adhesin for platelets isoform X1 [Stomoxys calcitrans]|uniref:serine-rich adhesin for platelets isoform X1 n=1 Tax=Stomoxys calcitrans TaxID=35570 RepID=UPI0027E3AAE5|nr:serine-rich adhesin for platelets isoform X1 [Stomoxys calcitrans]